MTLTKGFFTAPITLTAGSAHVTVRYTDLSTQDVTISAGTYYPQGDGGATDLFKAMADAFDAQATDGVNWTFTPQTSGLWWRIRIESDGSGAKTPDRLTFNTTELVAADLGFASSPITLILGVGTGTYRASHCWHPEEETYIDEDLEAPVVIQALSASTGVTDVYSAMGTKEMFWPRVWGALVATQYTADSDHAAAITGLNTADPNASLEAFLADVRSGANGDTPVVRWCPDRASPGTYENIILPAEGYTVPGWVQQRNPAPLWYTLGLSVRTPVS